MPEGPEVRREADRIGRVLTGKRLERVHFGLPRLAGFVDALSGTKVKLVEARGKALLIHFSNGLSLYSHNQLYGKWVVRKKGATADSRRSLRVALDVADHSALLFSASDIEVLNDAELARHRYLSKLGPDVLDPDLDWRAVAARLRAPDFNGRSLASLYLDQRFLAGVGNYLRSELLFDAGLDPRVRPRRLTRGEQGRLARSTLTICRRAYEQGGVTNHPPLVRKLRKAGLEYRDYRFAVFAREGLACYRCGSTIERLEAAGRRLYVCGVCQPAPE